MCARRLVLSIRGSQCSLTSRALLQPLWLQILQNQLLTVNLQLPSYLTSSLIRLQKALLEARREAETLSVALENPGNQSRWRMLEGKIPGQQQDLAVHTQYRHSPPCVSPSISRSPYRNPLPTFTDKEELGAKIQQLEERLNDKKESLMEKELILEEITGLSDKLRAQVVRAGGNCTDERYCTAGGHCAGRWIYWWWAMH